MLPNWAASPNRPKSLGRMGRTPVSPHLPSGRPPRFGLPPPPAASALYCTPFAQIFGSQLFKKFSKFKTLFKARYELNNFLHQVWGQQLEYNSTVFCFQEIKVAPFQQQYKFFFLLGLKENDLGNFDTIQGNLRVNTEALLFPPLLLQVLLPQCGRPVPQRPCCCCCCSYSVCYRHTLSSHKLQS